ncbi:MAG: FAD-linked oxidase C-terminal domain-containing protein [Desulforegulaceae bacterium]|nr:FAD-linked oxidase C-terminal domain-containing protein [Desulforegulaceae bacterium]
MKKISDYLSNIIPSKNILFKKEDLYCYSYDSKEGLFMPDCVIFPESTFEVSKILKFCCEKKIYAVPRGAGTGTTGGSVPLKGGVVICFSKMNKILEINSLDFYARVQPGVFTGDFQREVLKHKMFYPPDPASSDFCTLGGNIAECAGGPKAVKYGVTKDYVMGLEIVLPTGEIIHTGVKTVKGVTGYDITKLITGSEGTLAVITEAVLKLLPAPESSKTMISFFPSMSDAAKSVSKIIQKGLIPRVLEYMDHLSIECVKDEIKLDLPENTKALLIIESDGKKDFIESEIKEIENICKKNNAFTVISAEDEEVRKSIWDVRKSLSSSLFKYGPHKINEDIVVPRSKVPDVVSKIEELQNHTGLSMVSFGHAGDGNIHFNIILDKTDKIMHEKAVKAVGELFKYVIFLGGTLSGEHGIGISKKDYLHLEIDRNQRDLMRRIKNAFDPCHILNPGKII